MELLEILRLTNAENWFLLLGGFVIGFSVGFFMGRNKVPKPLVIQKKIEACPFDNQILANNTYKNGRILTCICPYLQKSFCEKFQKPCPFKLK